MEQTTGMFNFDVCPYFLKNMFTKYPYQYIWFYYSSTLQGIEPADPDTFYKNSTEVAERKKWINWQMKQFFSVQYFQV